MTDVEQASRQFMLAAERSTTLYALSEEYTHLVDLLDDPDVDAETIEAELDRLTGAIAHKAEAIAGLVKWYQGLANMRLSEARRMAESVHRFEGQAERLKAYLLRHMQATSMQRIDTGRFTLSVRQNPPRVEVLEAMAVPHEFQREKIIIETDRRAILEHSKKTGEIPEGVEIVRHERLDIR